MNSSNEILQLLAEIRDLQREHLQEYRKSATRAIETQELALQRQAAHLALYKRVLAVSGVALLALILYLLFFLNGSVV